MLVFNQDAAFDHDSRGQVHRRHHFHRLPQSCHFHHHSHHLPQSHHHHHLSFRFDCLCHLYEEALRFSYFLCCDKINGAYQFFKNAELKTFLT